MDDIDRLADILKEAMERMGGNSRTSDSYASLPAEEKQKKLLDDTNKKFKELNEQLAKGKKQYVNLAKDIKLVDDALSDLDDGIDKLELEMQRSALSQKFVSEQTKKAGMELTKVVAGSVVKGLLNSTKSLITSLQSGGSGIQLAADLMTNALDVNQSITTGASKVAESFGGAMQFAGGKTAKFGGALSIGASAVSAYTDAVTALAKQGIDLLAKEAEGRIKAFNESTAAGAIFAKGMDDMGKYAAQSGLTVAQFSNVVKTNSNLLADAGYTVADGAKIVAGVTSRFAVQTGKSGQTLQREMLNLGMGFEEQASVTAEVISNLKRAGGRATNGEVASATTDLAKDMRKVADIMGEEYKARKDAAEKDMQQYAFFEKINKRARETGDVTLLQRTKLAMSEMSQAERTALIQKSLTGTVSDFNSVISGASNSVDDMQDAIFNRVNPSLEDLTRGSNRFHDEFAKGNNQTLTAIGVAGAMTGAYGDTLAQIQELQQLSNKATSENQARAKASVDGLAGAQGGLQGELMGVETQAQSLKIAIQKELTPTIIKFASVANQVLSGVSKAVSTATNGKSTAETILRPVLEYGGMIAGGVGGAVAGTALAAGSAGVGTVAVPALTYGGGQIGQKAGSAVGDFFFGEQYANGGISSGPLSGYQAQLHGTEAVVPLPDGKSIPVEMKDSSNAATAKLMSQVVEELQRGNQLSATNFQNLIRAMKDGNNLTSGILQNSY